MIRRWTRTIAAPFALVCALALAAGCIGPPYVSGAVGIDVGNGPPGYRTEVRIASPGVGYYWIPGYWDWNDTGWYWVSGAWQRPPQANAYWVAPRYRHHRGSWMYYRGYWR